MVVTVHICSDNEDSMVDLVDLSSGVPGSEYAVRSEL